MTQLSAAARRALVLRQSLAKSSVSKLDTILSTLGPDDRLRYGYKFYGAHTGRWSAGGADSPTAQLQNFPRGNIEDVPKASLAIWEGRDLREFGQPLAVVSSCLRSAFRAPAGHHFVVADLSQIEVRVLAWLTDCEGISEVYAAGGDVYIDFATRLYQKLADDVSKHERQISKSAVLGCGYQLSGGEEKRDKHGDLYKSGLWGYAEGMGIQMSQDEAHKAVRVFRDEFWEVPDFWHLVETAAMNATLMPGQRFDAAQVSFHAVGRGLLYCDLPAGRRLHYVRPRVVERAWPDGSPKTGLTYEGMRLGQWGRRDTYGGHLTENIVQAIARDVLAEGMLRADEAGFPIVGHSHDEIITLVPDNSPLNLARLVECMTEPMPWAPDLGLAADGWEGRVYRK